MLELLKEARTLVDEWVAAIEVVANCEEERDQDGRFAPVLEDRTAQVLGDWHTVAVLAVLAK